MKDFDEFADFILMDCKQEMDEIGKSLGQHFSDKDFETIGMSVEALGTLMQVNSYILSRFVMFMLRRYHEWSETFPDSGEFLQ